MSFKLITLRLVAQKTVENRRKFGLTMDEKHGNGKFFSYPFLTFHFPHFSRQPIRPLISLDEQNKVQVYHIQPEKRHKTS